MISPQNLLEQIANKVCIDSAADLPLWNLMAGLQGFNLDKSSRVSIRVYQSRHETKIEPAETDGIEFLLDITNGKSKKTVKLGETKYSHGKNEVHQCGYKLMDEAEEALLQYLTLLTKEGFKVDVDFSEAPLLHSAFIVNEMMAHTQHEKGHCTIDGYIAQ